MLNLKMPNQIKSTTSLKMSCGTYQSIMPLQLVLFVLLSTTALMEYSYGSSSLAINNTTQHFAGNNNSRFVTLDQLSVVAVMDLQGNVDKGYRVTLRLGQHRQEYSFLIDTGSNLTWVNCQTRSYYHYPHPAYNLQAPNMVLCNDPICPLVKHPPGFPCLQPTHRCHYIVSYLDQTLTRGNLIKDSLALPFTNVDPSLLPPSIKIGCGTYQNHPSSADKRVAYDGVLGLSRMSLATIVWQLANKGIIRPVFGHCMSHPENGYFFIGAGQVLPTTITWAPMVTLHDQNHYSPGRANLLFDGHLTDVRNFETIFDSGSSVSYFKTSALRAIINQVKVNLVIAVAPLTQVHRDGYPICWRGLQPIRSVDEVAIYFKTMTLVFPAANNVRFELPPYTYLMVEQGDVCFGIDDGAKFGLGEVTLIGDIFFQNKLVVYDLHRQMIGWAPSNCNNRRMNDRNLRHMNDRNLRHRDLSRHRFSTIPVRRKPPLTNYTSIKL